MTRWANTLEAALNGLELWAGRVWQRFARAMWYRSSKRACQHFARNDSDEGHRWAAKADWWLRLVNH